MSYILTLIEENDFDDGVLAPWTTYNDGVTGVVSETGGEVSVVTYAGVDNQWPIGGGFHQIAVHRDVSGLAGGYAGKCRLYEFYMSGGGLVHGEPDIWGSQGGSAGIHLGDEITNRNWLVGWYTKLLDVGPPAVWANYCVIYSLEAGFSYTKRWEDAGTYGYDARFRAYVNNTAGAVVIEQDSFSLPAAHIAFYVSTDVGITYTKIYSGEINHIATNIEWVGLYACSLDGGTPECLICGGNAELDRFAAYDLTTTIDGDPPYVANANPSNGITVASPTNIEFDVVDDGEGTKLSSIIITIDSIIAWQNSAQVNGWSVSYSVIAGGFSFTLTPPTPFLANSEVNVSVYAADVVLPTPNDDTTLYSFFTEPFAVCNTPKIGPGFVFNHYICLPTNYKDSYESSTPKTVPFSFLFRSHLLSSGSTLG